MGRTGANLSGSTNWRDESPWTTSRSGTRTIRSWTTRSSSKAPWHRERRQARRGTPEGRAEGGQVRGDLLEVLPAAGPRPGRWASEAREQRDAFREAGSRKGHRPPDRRLPGPDAGGPVRAERLHPSGAEKARR